MDTPQPNSTESTPVAPAPQADTQSAPLSAPDAPSASAAPVSDQSFFGRIKQLLTDPEHFFEAATHEEGYHQAFRMFAILTPITIVLGILLQRLFMSTATMQRLQNLLGAQNPFLVHSGLWLTVLAVLAYVAALIGVFVWTGILHIWIMIWGGKGSYAETFRLNVYSSLPRLVFGWIPVVGGLVWIYDLILAIIGVQKLHKVSRAKAIWMFVLPLTLECIFVIMAIVAVFAFAVSMGSYLKSHQKPMTDTMLEQSYGTSTYLDASSTDTEAPSNY